MIIPRRIVFYRIRRSIDGCREIVCRGKVGCNTTLNTKFFNDLRSTRNIVHQYLFALPIVGNQQFPGIASAPHGNGCRYSGISNNFIISGYGCSNNLKCPGSTAVNVHIFVTQYIAIFVDSKFAMRFVPTACSIACSIFSNHHTVNIILYPFIIRIIWIC